MFFTDMEFEEKTERNKRVQLRYDGLMAQGKHGHYETMFQVVNEEIERERGQCRSMNSNPPKA